MNIIKSPSVTFFTGDDTCMSPGCEEADREAALETGEPHHGQNNTSHGGGATDGAVCVTESHTLTSSPSFGFNSFLLGIQVHGALKAHICLELEPMINFDLHPYKVDADHRFSLIDMEQMATSTFHRVNTESKFQKTSLAVLRSIAEVDIRYIIVLLYLHYQSHFMGWEAMR